MTTSPGAIAIDTTASGAANPITITVAPSTSTVASTCVEAICTGTDVAVLVAVGVAVALAVLVGVALGVLVDVALAVGVTVGVSVGKGKTTT